MEDDNVQLQINLEYGSRAEVQLASDVAARSELPLGNGSDNVSCLTLVSRTAISLSKLHL